MSLRPLGESDLPAIVAAERLLHETPWTEGQFRDSLEAGHALWILEDGAILLGYGVTMQVLDEAHLLNLSVLREHQRLGHGRRLLGELLHRARAAEARQMFLEVRAANLPARRLYAACGFQEIGCRKAYYATRDGSGREDAIVMSALLQEGH